MKVQTPLLTIALATLVGTAIAQIPGQQPARGTVQEAKVSQLLLPSGKLIGMTARNASDKDLGSLEDVIADPRTGELRYAILEVGGFLGMGATERILPWSHFEVSVSGEDRDEWRLRADLTKEQVSAAPECKDDHIFDSELDRRMESTFGKRDGEAARSEGKNTYARLSNMDNNVELRDASGRDVGEIENLIIAPEHNTIAFAVVQTNDEAGGKLVAVPAASLHFAFARADGDTTPGDVNRPAGEKRTGGEVRSDIDKGELYATTKVAMAKFAGAPEFDNDKMDRMSSTTWLTELNTYFGAEPFWKRTMSASSPAPKTRPSQQ